MRTETRRRAWGGALLAAATLTAPSLAKADGPAPPAASAGGTPAAVAGPGAAPGAPRDASSPPPSTGGATGVAGSILAVGGTASILALPFCAAFDGTLPASRRCMVGAGSATVVLLAVGLPLLALSEGQARAFKAWQAAHPGVAGLGLSAGGSGGGLTWSARF